MTEYEWTPLPFPFTEVATPQPLRRLDAAVFLERLLEDAAGQAGVLASAALDPEVDQADVTFALRVLAEHLHATVALWREWQALEKAMP